MSRILLHRVNGTDEEERSGERTMLQATIPQRGNVFMKSCSVPFSRPFRDQGEHQLFAFGKVTENMKREDIVVLEFRPNTYLLRLFLNLSRSVMMIEACNLS